MQREHDGSDGSQRCDAESELSEGIGWAAVPGPIRGRASGLATMRSMVEVFVAVSVAA